MSTVKSPDIFTVDMSRHLQN